MERLKRSKPRGQSIMEVLVAVGVFVVLASGTLLLVTDSLTSSADAGVRVTAASLVTQGLEAVRAMKENSWTSVTAGTHGLSQDGSGNWIFLGASDLTENFYTRSATIFAVERDGSGNIVTTGGTIDPRTKKATVTVSWTGGIVPVARSISRSIYITDHGVYDWTQTTDTDFGGGLTQDDVDVIGSGTSAGITLSAGDKIWEPRNNTPITHTTDTDWNGATGTSAVLHDTQAEYNSGTHSNTQYDVPNSWLELTPAGQTALTGNWTSPIHAATGTASWDTLNWKPQRPSGKELPSNAATETGYPTGNANMTGNLMLMHLNEAGGATSYVDSSGNTNTGTCAGAACPATSVTGKYTTAMQFNGTDDVVTVADAATLDAASQVTVEGWVNVAGNGTAAGDIGAAFIDSLNYDGANGNDPSTVQVAPTVFATAYRGPGGDGWVATYTADGAGNIGNALIDTLEWDAADGMEPSLAWVSGNIYMVAFRSTGDDGFVKTFTIDSAGVISNATIDTLEFDADDGREHSLVRVSSTVMAVAYRDTNGGDVGGWIASFTVDGAGNISNAVADTLEFDADAGIEPSMAFVTSNIYAVTFNDAAGGDAGGWVNTFTIDGATGAISNAIIDTLEFDTGVGGDSSLVRINATNYAVAFTGTGNDGWVASFTIDAAGLISNAITDSLEFDTGDSFDFKLINVQDDLYAVSYRSTGSGDDGFLKTFTIDAAGAIPAAVIDTLEFDATDGWEPDVTRVDEGMVIIPYRQAAVGRVASLEIATANNRGIVKTGAYGLSVTTTGVRGFINGTAITGALTAGWHHVAMTYDMAAGSNQQKLYVDGALVTQGTLSAAINVNTRNLLVGKFNQASFDEVGVYSRALTGAEITDRYRRGVLRNRFQVRSCNDAACSGETFIGPDGTAATFYTELANTTLNPPNLNLTNVPDNPWFQYRVTMETDNNTLSPEIVNSGFSYALTPAVTFSGTEVVNTGIPSSIREIGTQQWALAGAQGQSVYHSLDTDWNPGTFANTVVVGSAANGSVSLGYVVDWHLFPSPTTATLQDVQVVSSVDGFAVGIGGAIIRWNGTAWTNMTSPTAIDLYDVYVTNIASDGWAVGIGGEIIRWNGTTWIDYTNFTAQDLWELSCLSTSQCWASGNGGQVWFWNGTTWTQQTTPTGVQLFDIHMVNASYGWACGTGGICIKWNGTTWANDPLPVSETWRDITALDQNFAFLAGTNGVVLKWNGTVWTQEVTPGTDLLRGVTMLSPNFAFATGDNGAIYRWESGIWSIDTSPTAGVIRDVQPVATNEAWAGADGPDDILHYGQRYHSSGTFLSTIIDGGAGADWGTAYWDETLTANTDVTVAFRSGNTAVPDGSWSAWSAEFTTPTGSVIPSASSRYLQYRATFSSSHAFQTSLLNDILITYNEPPTTTIRDIVFSSSTDGWLVGDAGSMSRWNGTTWSATNTTTAQNLQSVDCVSTSDCWAVADAGQIVRWNGTSWINFVDTGAQIFRGVDMVAANDGWAVADSGQIYRWNGATWALNIDLGTHIFRGVSCVAAGDCWAVADSGRIARLVGAVWSQFVDTGAEQYNDVWMVSATDGWTVANGGTIRRWNGAAWNVVASTTVQNLTDVTCVTASDCWAVGAAGTVLHWNGTAWSAAASPTGVALEAVRTISANDAFAAGATATLIRFTTSYAVSATYDGQIIDGVSPTTTWDLMTWSFDRPQGTNVTIQTRSGPTPTPDGSWSAFSAALVYPGGSIITSPTNRYMQYRATFTTSNQLVTAVLNEIQIVTNASTKKHLFAAEGLTQNDVWSVGRDGTIIHYNGTQWQQVASPIGTDLVSVDPVSSTEAFAVGVQGNIVRYSGGTWSSVASGTFEDLTGVDMVNASFGIAVGFNGTIRQWNGSAWVSATGTDTTRLNGVSMLSATDGFAVGDGGKIIRWNGTTWSTMVSPTIQDLNSVHYRAANDAWAVGASGTIIRWNGTTWSTVPSPVSTDLNGIEAKNASNAWAVGDFGKIIEWDGSNWTVFNSAVTLDLYGITYFNPTDGWISGQHGMLLKDPPTYPSFGEFYSSILDTDSAASTLISGFWNATLPASTQVDIALRNGPTAVPDGAWGAFTSPLSNATGTLIVLPANRYVQYRATLSTSDSAVTPSLDDITITYR